MSLRATFTLLSVSLAVLILGSLGVMALHLHTLGALEAAENARYESFKLADELRQSSDDPTRMAHTYVVTDDARYEEYFNRILEIRNGEAPRPKDYDGIYWDVVRVGGVDPAADGERVALEELMRRANFTDVEFAKLRQAEAESNALVAIEARAMAAVKGLFPDAKGEYTREGLPDAALARELMHGAEYHEAKSRIMAPIADFMEMLESRTQRHVTAVRLRSKRLMIATLAIGLLSLSLVGASFFILHRHITVLETQGLPIGVMAGAEYETTSVQLQAGDRIYIYSDGLMEAMDDQREQFGCARIEAVIDATRGVTLDESIDALVDAAVAWQGSEHFTDDLSLLALEVSDPSH